MNVNRWVKYAKARIDAALAQGDRSLDRLEAEREAELAGRPWLGSDSDAPSLDEARARIEWEAEHQGRLAREGDHAPAPPDATAATGDPAPGAGDPARDAGGAGPSSGARGPAPRAPEEIEADASAASARLELEARQRESQERLARIREELGVEDPGRPTG